MTKEEQKMFERLQETIQTLQKQQADFIAATTQSLKSTIDAVAVYQKKIEQAPLTLEDKITQGLDYAIRQSAHEFLSKNGSSLIAQYANKAIAKYEDAITQIFDDTIQEAISQDAFKDAMRDAFVKKVGKSLASFESAAIDKVAQTLRNDATFRAKLTVMLNQLVTEFKL